MNVAICEYGAGNVRSVELAFARLGATVDRRRRATPTSPCCPGVGSARAAMAGLRERGHDEALRERVAAGRPVLGICLGLQLALDWTEEDGGVAGLGLLPGRAGAPARRPCPAHRLGRGRATGERLLLRALVRGRDAVRDGVVGGRSSPRCASGSFTGVPVPSREERRGGAATSLRCSRRRCASPSPDPVPRRRGRPRRQGRQLPGAARRRRSRRARRRPTRTRAPTSSSSSTSRRRSRPRDARRARAARRRAARDPVHGRRRRPHGRRRGGAARARARTRSSVNSAALERPALVDRARRAARLAGRGRRDRRRRRARPLARRHDRDRARAPPSGRARREERGAGEILLTSIDADGTRAGYDLDADARASRTRSSRAGDRLGRRRRGAATSPRRSRSRRRRCSRRSCTRIRRGSRRCAPSCATLGVPLRDAA